MQAEPQEQTLDHGPRKPHGTERLCAATGVVKPIDEMIRFVLAPDGSAVADLKRRLPGRGVWITATRTALRQAIARKAFARSFRCEVRVAPDLAEATERMLARAALDALAIAHKAGRAVIGFAKVEAALLRGDVGVLLNAADAAADGVRKLESAKQRAAADRRVATLASFASAQLNLALGRPNVVHAALLTGPECRAFLARVERLERFRTGMGVTDKPEKWERNG